MCSWSVDNDFFLGLVCAWFLHALHSKWNQVTRASLLWRCTILLRLLLHLVEHHRSAIIMEQDDQHHIRRCTRSYVLHLANPFILGRVGHSQHVHRHCLSFLREGHFHPNHQKISTHGHSERTSPIHFGSEMLHQWETRPRKQTTDFTTKRIKEQWSVARFHQFLILLFQIIIKSIKISNWTYWNQNV